MRAVLYAVNYANSAMFRHFDAALPLPASDAMLPFHFFDYYHHRRFVAGY